MQARKDNPLRIMPQAIFISFEPFLTGQSKNDFGRNDDPYSAMTFSAEIKIPSLI